MNHRLPSGPATIPLGELARRRAPNSVTVPDVVIRPTLFAAFSVNHRLPSGPAAMSHGELAGVIPVENSVNPLCPSVIVPTDE